MSRLFAACSLALALVTLSPVALACGGLFCSAPAGPVPPQPIDQNAERIIFDVGDGTVTTHVQIQYAGAADAFAWIVPVPSVPAVAESDDQLFRDLEARTAIQVQLPAPEACPQSVSGGSAGSGGCADSASFGGFESASQDSRDGESPVTVFAHEFTTNYEWTVVGAEETTVLVKWLRENGYNVSDNMAPVIAPYNGDKGAKFLALKLRGGKTASDIVPIAMTYESTLPVIPLRLTAVAAQPLMGVLVFIVGDRYYAPDNWSHIEPDASQVLFDGTGQTSYFEWVARSTAEAGGHQFVREFRGFNPLEGVPYTDAGVTLSGRRVSRFYTRVGPEHMDVDPIFAPDDAPDEPATGFNLPGQRVLDFTARPTLWQCGNTVIDERLPSPCAFNYCGVGATCTVADGRVGCACPSGATAQRVTGPDGADHVTCAPAKNPFGVTDAAGGAGTAFDPCATYPCGAGTCVLKGGFPTCSCSAGNVACLEPGGLLSCVAPGSGSTTFGPGAGTESAAPQSARATPPGDSRFAVTLWPPLAPTLLGLALWRRRVRARA